jgi:histidinol phosphatase-like PHP family hydrolase
MKNFENPTITDNAEWRRNREEKKGRLSISHWLIDTHAHTGYPGGHKKLEEIMKGSETGSNCGHISLKSLVDYYCKIMKNKGVVVTDHSREPNVDKALPGYKKWFEKIYIENRWGKNKKEEELSEQEKIEMKKEVDDCAKKIAAYGDERLTANLEEINQLASMDSFRIFRGIEANLTPDGNFDTPMVERGEFEVVNCSIHPSQDKRFNKIIDNPQKYTELVIKGIKHPKTNIMCHIGYGSYPSGTPKEKREKVVYNFTNKLDWASIAEAAIENNVAIEINTKNLRSFICNKICNYEKYPKGDMSYVDDFKKELPALIPILSSKKIRNQLKPYFKQGLKIAIGTDEHGIDLTKKRAGELTDPNQKPPQEIIRRFWRCVKLTEKYFNDIFSDLDIKKENIINTYSVEKLEKFFKKEIVNE